MTRLDPRMRLNNRYARVHTHLDPDGLRSIQICGNYISCGEFCANLCAKRVSASTACMAPTSVLASLHPDIIASLHHCILTSTPAFTRTVHQEGLCLSSICALDLIWFACLAVQVVDLCLLLRK